MQPPPDVEHGYENLIVAVRETGDRLLARQADIKTSDTFIRKADHSIVTAADFESEQWLIEAITLIALRPYVIVSEEIGSTLAYDGPDAATWYLDPIDGTANYAAGGSDFAILLSEWRFERPVFSIVYYPATRELRWAFNASNGRERETQQRTAAADTVHICYIGDKRLQTAVLRQVKGPCVLNKLESTRALFDLAAGKIGGVIVFLCGHGVWDVAALAHLVTASGGYFCDEDGREFIPKTRSLECSFLIAAPDRLKACALRRAVEVYRNGDV